MVRELIKQGEGEKLDFKQTITSVTKIAKTLSAFANTKGGIILVGVKDNGGIWGINFEEEKHMLEGAADLQCKPPVPIEFGQETINNKTILIAEVKESSNKPHYSRGVDGKWWAYIRVKDQTLLASKVMLDVMKSDTSGRTAKIKYGWPEKKLLDYLNRNDRITQKEFCKLANISKWRANKILVNLVRMGVIKVLCHEKVDFYSI